ncbi:SNW domain-containing protein 1 [Bonamia ostreae]|uniref:SNW domain-containing protein 1 n=1 Tax=Bonamia ostreae TaxID=126728 RepID=A0ABV2AHQ7_9EUKA
MITTRPENENYFDKQISRKPTREEGLKNTEQTRTALEKIISGKIEAKKQRDIRKAKENEPVYVKFEPAQQHNSALKTRVIRLQEMPLDPLDPPKHRFRKQPMRASSPPPPVLQSPPRKLSRKEAAEWKIPPCVSNWKNVKSYTIPLDKRVAADGRGYESFTINSRFSALSTALYEAENVARENVRLRGEQVKRLAQQKRQKAEAELEKRAMGAIQQSHDAEFVSNVRERMEEKYNEAVAKASNRKSASARGEERPRYKKSSEESAKRLKERILREKLRKDRMHDRRRELRQEERKKKRGHQAREKRRDISEKIALGQSLKSNNIVMYDSRLFNRDSGGELEQESD